MLMSSRARKKAKMKKVPGNALEYCSTPPAEEKLSQRLINCAMPLMDESYSFEELEKLVMFAITAWNGAVTPGIDLDGFIRDLDREFEVMRTDQRREVERILRFYYQRKLELYPDDQRVVVDQTISRSGDGLHLQVVSASG